MFRVGIGGFAVDVGTQAAGDLVRRQPQFTHRTGLQAHGVGVDGVVGVARSFIDRYAPGVHWGVAAPVPEPETYAMLLAGLGLLGYAARRRKLKEAVAA